MYQGLVMAIAFQICAEVVIHETDEYTTAFHFNREEGVTEFINELEAYAHKLSLTRIGLDVLVNFVED